MVDVAQLAERRDVNPEDARSKLVVHPSLMCASWKDKHSPDKREEFGSIPKRTTSGTVAELEIALPS